MANLFESIQLGSLVLTNRVLMAPLTRNRADADGVPSELAATYYSQRASADLIVTESTQGSSRRLLARLRLPPIRGHTLSAPRYGLRGVGCLKQLPKLVFQEFYGLSQSTKLPSPNYRDRRVQLKRWGPQYFHGIDRVIPGNKASRQQPDTITGLNEC